MFSYRISKDIWEIQLGKKNVIPEKDAFFTIIHYEQKLFYIGCQTVVWIAIIVIMSLQQTEEQLQILVNIVNNVS